VYRIRTIGEDSIEAVCVYGEAVGNMSEFHKVDVINAIFNQLTN